jgi:nitrogen fixation-related uncharacterized protein
MKTLLKTIVQFTLVAAIGLLFLLYWCFGVKFYYDKQLETERILNEKNIKIIKKS